MSQGSVSVESEPEGAEVYLDSEYQGMAPCIIKSVHTGSHMLELSHPEYPGWNRSVLVMTGETLNITADLSKNAIPDIKINSEEKSPYAWVGKLLDQRV